MSRALPGFELRHRAIRLWLIAVAALIVVTLIVGGATRLTESGLSIVEWRPITGLVPPLSPTEWQAEFEKYRAIPQYRAINSAMGLGEFKVIYWWEWTHRFLGRFIGAAFLFPFLWFLWRGWIAPPLRARLWAIFALGALQGGVGWWMVASGLAERIDVSQYRLATHLTLACVIYAAVLWTIQQLTFRGPVEGPPRVRRSAVGLLILVLMQIYLGALVAGLDAGLTYNTWPLIGGSFIPGARELFAMKPLWRNFFENRLTVQFDHRMIAYLLWVAAIFHLGDVARTLHAGPALRGALVLAAAITLQAIVGVMTLLQQAPLGLALMHQAIAIVVLTAAVLHAERLAARVAQAQVSVAALTS